MKTKKQETIDKNWLEYVCEKCKHEWIPRGADKPKSCPNCKRYDWDVETEDN